ncbi:MAG: T9SS type A sorting domain-containing protein [Bacteroidia bacterium]|nr:T9SS type A sorting domain-containing protein [Bacteroidia bacterium]MCF8425763.1 T9SS type A sorting domain-containing protein [Bacteroidia bacterium]MCF8447015.1 T9SS type A sorting domain-containing protein [Bacteroidia bacterium]
MKSIIFSFIFGLFALILLESFDSKSLKKVDGTDPGYTGSPGDSLKNCTVCHGGTATLVEGWITSDIPSTGFVAGNTYQITATNTSDSHNRFGFSISPQDMEGKLLGTLIATDTARTQINGNGKYITYKPAGVPNNNFAVWKFNWVAPSDGTNEVVFYGAFNSNQDGHKGGDLTRLSTLKVFKEGFTSIGEISENMKLNVFPNPTSEYLNFEINKVAAGETSIKLYSLNGEEVSTLFNETLPIGVSYKKFDISQLKNGVYLVQTISGVQSNFQKVVIMH